MDVVLRTLLSISRYVIFGFTTWSSVSQHCHQFHNIISVFITLSSVSPQVVIGFITLSSVVIGGHPVTRSFRSVWAWSFGNAITLRDSSILKKSWQLSILSVVMGGRNPKDTDAYRAAASLALNVGKQKVGSSLKALKQTLKHPRKRTVPFSGQKPWKGCILKKR